MVECGGPNFRWMVKTCAERESRRAMPSLRGPVVPEHENDTQADGVEVSKSAAGTV